MYVLSLLKKTAQPTEYYFDDESKASLVLQAIAENNLEVICFSDDHGQKCVVAIEQIVEASIIDAERKKLAIHELKMIDEYSKIKIHKATLEDPRTAEIMEMQKPITQGDANAQTH